MWIERYNTVLFISTRSQKKEHRVCMRVSFNSVRVTKRKTMLNIENQNKPLKKYAAFKEMRSLFINDIIYYLVAHIFSDYTHSISIWGFLREKCR
uniref:Uncharacterized protein n=1 Tax=Glossina brevipalpis TaxID=37001 RepID=A0A1A9WHN8_9MUSC